MPGMNGIEATRILAERLVRAVRSEVIGERYIGHGAGTAQGKLELDSMPSLVKYAIRTASANSSSL
jgi:hypothetical protein